MSFVFSMAFSTSSWNFSDSFLKLQMKDKKRFAILCRNDWKIKKLDFDNTVFEYLLYGVKFKLKRIINTISQQFITRLAQPIWNLIYLTICPKVVNRFFSQTPVQE